MNDKRLTRDERTILESMRALKIKKNASEPSLDDLGPQMYDVMKYHRSVGIIHEHADETRYVHYFFPFKEQWADDRYFIQEPDGQFYLESPVKSAE